MFFISYPLPIISMSHRPTVHWIFPMPTPYGNVLFRELHRADFINLLVHYCAERVASHPWKTDLRKSHPHRIQKPVWGIDWFLIKQALFDKEAFFVGGWGDLTSVLLIILCLILRRKYIFETDTPNMNRKRQWLFAIMRTTFLRVGFKMAYAILHTGAPAYGGLLKMGASKDKLVNFPFWVDDDVLANHSSARKSPKKSFFRFVSIGRLINKRKGHDFAIRALAKVFKNNPSVDFEFLILGEGPDRSMLIELTMILGIGDKVKMPGWVEPDDVVKILQKSDILIHPSPVHEPYGVAVIEAMAAGMVVFASDVTCAGLDRIKHGVNGFVYRTNFLEDIVEQINWLLQNPDKMYAIGNEAARTGREWPVQRGVEIIKKLLVYRSKKCNQFFDWKLSPF